MSEINGDSPAYPVVVNQVPLHGEHSELELEHAGMTLRARIAMAAMEGWIACPTTKVFGSEADAARKCAEFSTLHADAIIAELNKPKTE